MIPLTETQPHAGASLCEARTNSSDGSLIHDLRQPLSIIETCACCLRMMLKTENAQVLEQLDRIEDQVLVASLLLAKASGVYPAAPGDV
jgi:hypothetical protein